MDLYVICLLLFILLLATAVYWQQHHHLPNRLSLIKPTGANQLDLIDDDLHDLDADPKTNRFHQFLNRFLLIHGLSVAADWLQSPYIYSLYRNNHGLPDPVTASLFAAGFLFRGFSTPFVGTVANSFGRKRACQLYCILYMLSSLTVLSGSLPVLVLGRALAGVSSCLLSTVFEMWMLGEFRRLDFGHAGEAVKYAYCSINTMNGFVSVTAGILSHILVQTFASEVAPFMASIACLALAFVLISRSWVENYESKTLLGALSRPSTRADSMTVLALGVAICALEAPTSLVFAFWAPSIIHARDVTFTWYKGKIPLGLVFAQLTSASTLGSFGFTYLSAKNASSGRSSLLIQLSLAVCSLCLLVPAATDGEMSRFWSLCTFQFFVGVCSSSTAYVKDQLLEQHQKEKMNGLISVPLNMVVVGALATVGYDDAERGDRFMVCSGLLLVATMMMTIYMPRATGLLPNPGRP